jgi:hypothetical protein
MNIFAKITMSVTFCLNRHSTSGSAKGKSRELGPIELDDNAVYLEDIDNSELKAPSKRVKEKAADMSSSSSKKSRFYDHDPYRLPEVDIEEAVAKATRSAAPDPRLATEEELRAFIEDMRPEDFDVTSPAFRELPTEVQYEIVGDLRLKSRQTSYKRLQNMLKHAPTPLDFSRQQIKNLQQRNALTQQLLMTTDSIGKAHLTIPVRIASERNKEYVLMKNEGEGGGWILGIRDDGTRAKPIEIDQNSSSENDDRESDEEMEEVVMYVSMHHGTQNAHSVFAFEDLCSLLQIPIFATIVEEWPFPQLAEDIRRRSWPHCLQSLLFKVLKRGHCSTWMMTMKCMFPTWTLTLKMMRLLLLQFRNLLTRADIPPRVT